MDIDQLKFRQKYTAIWAFSESVFGGILHALKIPFTGLFLGGFAIIILSSIANFVDKKSELIKVTLIVIAIKFMMSPNTPLTAYLAVMLQGLFAFIFFSIIKNRILAISLLSFFTALWSVSQKIIVTTVIFGMNFWYSIDSFSVYVLKSFGIDVDKEFSMSIILIAIYLLIHLLGAVFFARLAIKLPIFLQRNEEKYNHIKLRYSEFNNDLTLNNSNSQKMKKRRWYKKTSRIVLVLFLLSIALITYVNPELAKIKLVDVISMIVRAIIIIYLWFNVISPFAVKVFMKSISKKYDMTQLEEITSLFPELKKIIAFSWKINSHYPRSKRIFRFIKDSILLLMK
jgi:hypothetical protein